MDILKDITGSENKDIIISLQKDKSWLEYLSYFMKLSSENKSFDIVVRTVPKTAPKNKCFIVFDGFLRGWMEIGKIKETTDNDICIELIPILTTIAYKAPMSDIDEYKYFFDNSNDQ